MNKLGWLGGMTVAVVGLLVPTVVHAAGWQTAAFPGRQVALVVVHPQRANEMAAVVDGVLELTHDGGMLWDSSPLNVPVRALAYDPVYIGRIYAGTDSGLYVSEDNGKSWRLLESQLTSRKLVSAVFVDTNYVFAAMYDGAGTAMRVLRFQRNGVFIDTNLPSGNASSFDYDYAHHHLYVGAAGGVYASDDEGATWSGGGNGAGQLTQRVVVKSDAIWQLSADGLFRSVDDGSTWKKLAGPGDLNETSYGSDMRLSGLAVNHGRAFYGDWSYSYPFKFLAEYDGGAAHSILDARVYDVADGGNRLWAATDSGLMVNNDISSTEATIRRPVVIIPGILGSLPTSSGLAHYFENVTNGHWGDSYETPLVLDPIEHTYDGLVSSLLNRGYQLNRTLFLFPYDWTRDNAVTAGELGQKIYDIRQVCGCSQVDVVAHSMGGLVARSYIQSNSYGNDVRNLIELATPNAGAAEAYRMWEDGTDSHLQSNSHDRLLNIAVDALSASATAPERAVVVRRQLPSVEQLLPIFDYLVGRHYPDGYPRNLFLEQLNQPMAVSALRQRVSLYIVGSQSLPTLNLLTVGQPSAGAAAWPDGPILGSEMAVGDGTVSSMSLEAIAGADAWFSTDHQGIVGAAASFVARILMGGYLDDDDAVAPPTAIQSHTALEAQGPVALSLTDVANHTVDEHTIGIPGSYYSGPSVSPQLLIAPSNPIETYRVTITGLSTGSYRLEAANLFGENDTGTSDDGMTAATGTIAAGQQITYSYNAATQTLTPAGTASSIAAVDGSANLWPSSGKAEDSLGSLLDVEFGAAIVREGSAHTILTPDPVQPPISESSSSLRISRGFHLLPPASRNPVCLLGIPLLVALVLLAWYLKRLRL